MSVLQKKLFLQEGESVDDISKRIAAEKSKRLILRIPEDSFIFSSEDFGEIKRVAEKKNKELAVESKDALVLKRAEEAGISVINVSLSSHKRPFMDITPKREIRLEEKEKTFPDFFSYVREKHHPAVQGTPKEESRIDETEETREDFRFERSYERKKGSKRFFLFLGIIVLVFLGVAAGLYYALPKATIVISLKKIPVDFNETIAVSSKISEVTSTKTGLAIPGELFTAHRNLEIPFTSTSTERVETKATGNLLVYNAYSSAPQKIVATTRFVSPDGKVFRLDKATTIPGGKVVNKRLIPSSIEVSVTADKAGEEYNIPPAKLWTIPGFKGSDKYNGFYAESTKPMTGGFVGERPVLGKDTHAAEEAISSALKEALEGEMAVLMSGKYTLLSGASSFVLDKQDIQPSKNNPSAFNLFGEASMKQMVFDEGTLKDAIREKIRPSGGETLDVSTFTLTYSPPKVNLDLGTELFNATGTVVFEEHVDKDGFLKRILGLSEEDLKKTVFALPGLQKANISLWPFWVHTVPTNANRVTLTFE